MSISIFLAKSARHLDLAYRLRYDVLAEEEGLSPADPSRRILDRFDCLPGGKILIALDSDKQSGLAVGTLRMIVGEPVGPAGGGLFDFSPITSKLDGRVATISMLAVRRRFRARRGLISGLVKVASREITRAGVRHVVALVSPDAESLLREMGAQKVGASFEHGNPPVTMTPLHLRMDQLSPMFREMMVDPKSTPFEQFEERRIYRRGDLVLEEGQPGSDAYLIMRGSVRAHTGDEDRPTTSYLLGPGELFGELALLDGGAHPVSVRVHSKMLDVAVIPRSEFQKKLTADTVLAQRLLKILGQRLRRLLLMISPESMLEINQESLIASVLFEASHGGTKPVHRRWLASDCGVTEGRLEELIAPWLRSGVLRLDGANMLEVSNVETIRIMVDHLVDAHALAAGSQNLSSSASAG